MAVAKGATLEAVVGLEVPRRKSAGRPSAQTRIENSRSGTTPNRRQFPATMKAAKQHLLDMRALGEIGRELRGGGGHGSQGSDSGGSRGRGSTERPFDDDGDTLDGRTKRKRKGPWVRLWRAQSHGKGGEIGEIARAHILERRRSKERR